MGIGTYELTDAEVDVSFYGATEDAHNDDEKDVNH
jgi:hypothetical protein